MRNVTSSYASHDFLQVARLVPLSQEVVTVQPDVTVREALKVMSDRGFDQLPVVAGDQVISMFSYRSLSKALFFVRRNDDPLDLPVLDASEDMSFVHAGDDVGAILGRLERYGAVGVGDPFRLDAVMTTADVTGYLWDVTRPFVLLQDIELAVRALMRITLVDESVQSAAFARALSSDRLRGEGAPNRLDELTMSELLSVLLQAENYGRLFSALFGMSKLMLIRLTPLDCQDGSTGLPANDHRVSAPIS